MKRVLKLAAVAAASLVVLGCGTVNLNKAITGTDCTTREECVKALNLRNPEKADLTFVVKPYEFNIVFKNAYGVRHPFTGNRTGNAAYCVADAIKRKFGNSRILIDDTHKRNDLFVMITDVETGGSFRYSEYAEIKASVFADGKKNDIKGFSSIGILRKIDEANDAKVYKGACADIAKQIKKLVGENQPAKTGMAGN